MYLFLTINSFYLSYKIGENKVKYTGKKKYIHKLSSSRHCHFYILPNHIGKISFWLICNFQYNILDISYFTSFFENHLFASIFPCGVNCFLNGSTYCHLLEGLPLLFYQLWPALTSFSGIFTMDFKPTKTALTFALQMKSNPL